MGSHFNKNLKETNLNMEKLRTTPKIERWRKHPKTTKVPSLAEEVLEKVMTNDNHNK